METVDWIIAALAFALAIFGYLQGFAVGAFTLAGFVAGGFLGTRLAPHLLSDGSRSPYAPLLGIVGALLVGGLAAAALEGLGLELRQLANRARLGVIDGLLGAVLMVAVGLGLAWILGAVMLQAPGTSPKLRMELRRSAVLKQLNTTLPPNGSILRALARFDPFPRIDGPDARVAAPPPGIGRTAGVRGAAPGVVKVLGSACGLGVEGSGWIARTGIVVTNAHVVAGQRDTTVAVTGSGPKRDAQAVWFDPVNDIAVLRVQGLSGRTLARAGTPAVGTAGALLGFPQDGPYDVSPVRLGATAQVITQDAYGAGPVRRAITSLRGRVRHGNSGGPIVDSRGRVVATVFAATAGGGSPGGYAVPDSIVERALKGISSSPVSTGGCVG